MEAQYHNERSRVGKYKLNVNVAKGHTVYRESISEMLPARKQITSGSTFAGFVRSPPSGVESADGEGLRIRGELDRHEDFCPERYSQ